MAVDQNIVKTTWERGVEKNIYWKRDSKFVLNGALIRVIESFFGKNIGWIAVFLQNSSPIFSLYHNKKIFISVTLSEILEMGN